jgi:hypothetical protein
MGVIKDLERFELRIIPEEGDLALTLELGRQGFGLAEIQAPWLREALKINLRFPEILI